MKLRNKKTGEIKDACEVLDTKQEDGVLYKYYSLAELNEEWEDYEEPTDYWYIDYDGRILCGESDNSSAEKMMISIGNYFSTLEEAEKAVEKLKAVKRLKDNGFRFDAYHIPAGEIHFDMEIYKGSLDEVAKDMSICFGGEE